MRASCGNNLVLHANAWDKILYLKTQIEQKTHIPAAFQCLIHDCEPLNDHDTLDQCDFGTIPCSICSRVSEVACSRY